MITKEDDAYVISEDDILTGKEVLPGSKRVAGRRAQTAAAPTTRREAPIEAGIEREARPEIPIMTEMPRLSLTTPSRVPIASTLSLLVCGAGQVYNGQRKLGLLLFLTELLAVIGHGSLMKSWSDLAKLGYLFQITETQMLLTVAAADFLLIFFLLFNVGQAYRRAEKFAMPYEGLGMPTLSACASTLIPGWGQILNGQPGKALAFLFFLFAGVYAAAVGFIYPFSLHLTDLRVEEFLLRGEALAILGFGFFAGLIWMLSIYDAFLVARYRRELI